MSAVTTARPPLGHPGVPTSVGRSPPGSPSLRRTSIVTGEFTNVEVESSRAYGGRATDSRRIDTLMSLVTSWPYPSVTVYVKRALVSSRSPIEPGVNCTVSPTTTSRSPSGSLSFASTPTATDEPITTVPESAVSTGGLFGSASSITSTSTHPRAKPPRPSDSSYWNGRGSAAPVRATSCNCSPCTRTSSPGGSGVTTVRVMSSPSGSVSFASTGTWTNLFRRARTASGRATGSRLGAPDAATSTLTSMSSPWPPSRSTGRYENMAVPSKPTAGTNLSAGWPESPTVSVTSPTVGSAGGANEPMSSPSRSGSTSFNSTSTVTGVAGPVSAKSTVPTGAEFVAPAGSSSTTTTPLSSVPLPSMIVYSNRSRPT